MKDSKTCGCGWCKGSKVYAGKRGSKSYQHQVNQARRRIRRAERLNLKKNPDDFNHPVDGIGYFA